MLSPRPLLSDPFACGIQTIRSPQRLVDLCRELHREEVTIGLVPTMGALHDGHRSLIRQARSSCDAVIVSLFVNPRQFGPKEDLARYPRRAHADKALCRKEGVDVLFLPSTKAMYPVNHRTRVHVETLSARWEGEARPGHCEGVTTVVTKLLSLVQPDKAFFGQKDYQQFLLIRQLVRDLHFTADVVLCPTMREPDGLAISSRNTFLTPAQRRAAPLLIQALLAGSKAIHQGETTACRITQRMRAVLQANPRAKVDYLAVCDRESLDPLSQIRGAAVLLGAIRLGSVRLIDNVLVTPKKNLVSE